MTREPRPRTVRERLEPGLARLRRACPWPEREPLSAGVRAALTRDPWLVGHGWCGEDKRRAIARFLPADVRVIVELGSWLGSSTRFLCRIRPRATVIAVDHWRGSSDIWELEPRLAAIRPILHEMFLWQCWALRERIMPLRARSIAGMRRIARDGVSPGAVYIDAAHDYRSVRRDIETARELFPRAVIVGDDYGDARFGVTRAVDDFADANAMRVDARPPIWRLRTSGGGGRARAGRSGRPRL